LLVARILFFSAIVFAADVTLAWDANTESDLAGYRIYYRSEPFSSDYEGVGVREGDSPITLTLGDLDNPASPRYRLHGLSDTATTFLVVTAYDYYGTESSYSNQVYYNPDNDGDGIADWWEVQYFESLGRDGVGDWDNDGLIDLAEFEYLTDPTDPDSDNDQFSDGNELAAATDPTDPQSYPWYTGAPFISPPLEGPDGCEKVELEFWHYFYYGNGTSASTDIGHVLIQTYDNGEWSIWQYLATVIKSSDDWRPVQIDLAAYAGMRLRMWFYHGDHASTGAEQSYGWYIDDVEIICAEPSASHIDIVPEANKAMPWIPLLLLEDQPLDSREVR